MYDDPLYRKPIKTLVQEADIVKAVKTAYHFLFNYDPSLDTLAILSAQIFLECGRGKSCYNFNLGNIKRIKGKPFTMYPCGERINGVYYKFEPPHPQTHFSAYDSLADAALKHLSFLNKDRYKASFAEANCGNPEQFCEELSKAGYFTAEVGLYKKTLLSLFEEIRTKYKDEAEDDPYC